MNNRLEKIIDTIAPGIALKREQDRQEKKFLATIGSYDAASKVSAAFERYFTTLTDANTAMDWDRDTIIERSRDLSRNNGIASAISSRISDHTIGDNGLTCQPKIDWESLGISKEEGKKLQKEFKKEWELFAQDPLNDFYRDVSPQRAGYNVLQSKIEGGDCVTLLPKMDRAGTPYRVKTQLIEGELVSNPNFGSNTDKFMFGFERDTNGIYTDIHVSNSHPGDMLSHKTRTWSKIAIYNKFNRRNVLHHWDKLRPGQTRGIPLITAVMEKILMLETLSKAELLAAVVDSYYVMIFKGARDKTQIHNRNTNNNPKNSTDKFKLGSGSILRIGKDEDVKDFSPNRPNKLYRPFYDAIVTEIGAAISVAKSLIMILFDRSYSASTGEVLLSWVAFLGFRSQIANSYYQPLYETVIDEAIALGRLSAPGYFSDDRIRKAYLGNANNQWFGPGMPPFDALKDAKAEQIRIMETKIQSRQDTVLGKTGGNWMDDVWPEVEEELEKIFSEEDLEKLKQSNLLGVNNEAA